MYILKQILKKFSFYAITQPDLTIGQKTDDLLTTMSRQQWVFDKEKKDYTLTVNIKQEDDFILNYMTRIGISKLTKLTNSGVWYSWPDVFTGKIVIHSPANCREKSRTEFVNTLRDAINHELSEFNQKWQFNNDLSLTNTHMSKNMMQLILNVARKHDLNIQAIQGPNAWDWTIHGDKQTLNSLIRTISNELKLPQPALQLRATPVLN